MSKWKSKDAGIIGETPLFEPFLRTLEDRIGLTAEAHGKTKAQVSREFIRGGHPLSSQLGAAWAGLVGEPI
jgi:hypothetical protein